MRSNGWEPGMRWWGRGVSGARPPLPVHLVERPDLLAATVRALCARERPVAVVGIGGAGKSTLAGQACADREVQRAFRDGIAWLEAGPGKYPEALLADLAVGLELNNAAITFGTKEQGREQLAAALRSRRILIAVDNVCEARQLDVLTGLTPKCTVLFTTRLSELAKPVKAEEVRVDELTQDQALELLGRWTDRAPAALPDAARALCARAAVAPAVAAPSGRPPTRAHSARAAPGNAAGARSVQRPSNSSAWSWVSSSTLTSSALTGLASSDRRVVNSTVHLGVSPVRTSSWRASHTLSTAISIRLLRSAAASCSRPCSFVPKVIAALFSSRPTARSASSASGYFPGPASSQAIPSRKARCTSRSAHACPARVDLPAPPIPTTATGRSLAHSARTVAASRSGRSTRCTGSGGRAPETPRPHHRIPGSHPLLRMNHGTADCERHLPTWQDQPAFRKPPVRQPVRGGRPGLLL